LMRGLNLATMDGAILIKPIADFGLRNADLEQQSAIRNPQSEIDRCG
jgi:hypothetical protein